MRSSRERFLEEVLETRFLEFNNLECQDNIKDLKQKDTPINKLTDSYRFPRKNLLKRWNL